ncbi:FecR family protein [Mariniflexile sp. HNIBRBA6329]|uniref:FecR family protein n=1 Tax=Mariniflexile sp. HNIBRBA6329 TaxID=3373088 RepID=UPI003744FC1A
MENHFKDSTFLARWISGELTPEELNDFKNSKDYQALNKINEASQLLETPSYNSEALFNSLKTKINTKQQDKAPTVIKLIPTWVYGVAASIVLAFGLFYYLNTNKHFETSFSEQLAVVLPDDSKVQLNANSQLDFKSRNWDNNRVLNLNGEAFFDVEKGAKFKVLTQQGIVEVLGTEFNVISRNDYFEVQCLEGKVRVESLTANKEAILLPGKAIRILNKTAEEWGFILIDEPNWVLGESTFMNTPISQVLLSIENQYNIHFDTSNIDLSKRFTGGFTHKDLNLALKTVFVPMEISYSSNGNNQIILVNSKNKN